MESPVWTPMGSKFSMEQTMMTLSARSRITSSSNSFQPSALSSMRTSWTGERSSPRSRIVYEIFVVVGDAAAGTAHGETGAQDRGVAVLGGEGKAALDVGDELRARGLEADFAHRVFEEEAVFGLLDGVDFGADQFDSVAIEDAGFGQFDGEVQGGLSAYRGEQGVGPFLGDDFFEIWRLSGST